MSNHFFLDNFEKKKHCKNHQIRRKKLKWLTDTLQYLQLITDQFFFFINLAALPVTARILGTLHPDDLMLFYSLVKCVMGKKQLANKRTVSVNEINVIHLFSSISADAILSTNAR